MNIHPLRKQTIRVVRERDDESAALELLRRDPMYHRIPASNVSDLIRMALAIGRGEAAEVVRVHDSRDPVRLARFMNVRVIIDIERSVSQSFTILSRYQPKPPTIVVFENALRHCRERLAESHSVDGFVVKKLTGVCVAHELYHHRERTEMRFINMSCRLPVVNLGFLRVERSIAALSEIAAHAFAKDLLQLPVLPCHLDISLLEADWASRPPRE